MCFARYCAWIPVEVLVIYFFYKETRGRTLEELAVVFDGEAAKVAGNADDLNADGLDVLEARATAMLRRGPKMSDDIKVDDEKASV